MFVFSTVTLCHYTINNEYTRYSIYSAYFLKYQLVFCYGWCSSSTQQSDRYFECVQASSEVDSSCDPKAVVLSVRESLLQDQNENTENVHKCAITLLEAALRTNPHEEVINWFIEGYLFLC